MNFTASYNGVDITAALSADMHSCILTDRYGGLLDSVRLAINDSEKKWCKYGMVKGDEIAIKTDGYSTGTMYLAKLDEKNGWLSIDAVSLKPTKKVAKSKIWRYVRLNEVLRDCAKDTGLTLKTYGITDFYYESLAQIKMTDLDFACWVCKREGYSVKVDSGCLIVFNERYLESQDTALRITPDDVDSDYSFSLSSGCTNNVTVSHYDREKGLIEHTATDDNIIGGAEVINERVTSFDEAERFAYGYLRERNKRHVIGYLTMPYNPAISAATVFKAEGFQDFDGKYVVIEVSHNIKKEVSSLTVRKVLDY